LLAPATVCVLWAAELIWRAVRRGSTVSEILAAVGSRLETSHEELIAAVNRAAAWMLHRMYLGNGDKLSHDLQLLIDFRFDESCELLEAFLPAEIAAL
jgi:hypothetical protein